MPWNSRFKACLFDVDHTLTNSRREITPRTWAALEALAAQGVTTSLCSGRHFVTLKHMGISQFPSANLHISAGGGQIIDSTGRVFWEKRLDAKTVKKVITLGEKMGRLTVVCEEGRFYSSDLAVSGESKEVTRVQLARLPRLDVPLVTVYGANPKLISALTELKTVTVKEMLSYDGIPYVDVTAQGVTKGRTFEIWCKLMRIPALAVIGFGDSDNDIEFLQACGYAIAMGNATANVKAVSNEVIDESDADGVALYIEKNL